MIRSITSDDIPRLKKIWRETFLDPDNYIDDVIFKYKVTSDTVLLLEKDGVVASVVYMPRSKFSFWGKDVESSYVMGVATDKAYRGHSYMKGLMEEALRVMYSDGIIFCTLIPADDWLYEYYASFGFREAFYLKRERIKAPLSKPSGIILSDGIDERSMYKFYSDFYGDAQFCMKKSFVDFEAVTKDHILGKGRIRIAKKDGNTVGMAFVTGSDGCTIKELLANERQVHDALITDVADIFNADHVNLISRPKSEDVLGIYRRGMIRAVKIHDAIRLYAQAHRDEKIQISVFDDIIKENSGVYAIEDGFAMKISDKPCKNALSTNDLMELLLSKERCYMNLMLD